MESSKYRISETIFKIPVTYIQRKNVKTVLRDSTVAAAVLQTLIISMVTIDDSYDLSCDMERKRVECAIMIKAALADTEGEEE